MSVRRSNLLALRQADGENIRSFHARIKGKAVTCAYSVDCSSTTCTQVVDFKYAIIKEVLISGLSDEEVKMEVFGWHDLDRKTVDQTVQFIEAKEIARNALARNSTMSAILSYKKNAKPTKSANYTTGSTMRPCKDCSTPKANKRHSRRSAQL